MLPKRSGARVVFPVGVALALVLSALSASVAFAGSGGGPHGYQGAHETPRPGVIARSPLLSPSCSGYACDNTDPVQTGCSNTAYTATSAPIKYNGTTTGEVDNRYSTACATNWSRVIGYSGYGGFLKFAWVCRDNTRPYCANVYSNTAQSIYSNQVYAPSPICATAYGDIDLSYAYATGNATAC
jgi:hypothetical protein